MAKSPGSCQHCYQRGEREREGGRDGVRGRDSETGPAALPGLDDGSAHIARVPLSRPPVASCQLDAAPAHCSPSHPMLCVGVMLCSLRWRLSLSLSAQSVGRRVLIRAHLLERSLSDPISSDFLLCAFCFTYRELPWACDSD